MGTGAHKLLDRGGELSRSESRSERSTRQSPHYCNQSDHPGPDDSAYSFTPITAADRKATPHAEREVPGPPHGPWSIAALAFNLNSAVKQLAMGGEWLNKRLKAISFGVVNLPGRMVRHLRRMIIRMVADHSSYGLLIRMRRRTLALAADP